MNRWLEIIGDSLLIGFAGVLGIMGILLPWRLDGYIGQEGNLTILIMEILTSLGIIIIGINRIFLEENGGLLEYLSDAVIICGGIIFLGMFTVILFKGGIMVSPMSQYTYISRTLLTVGLVILGVGRLIGDAKEL